MYPTFNDEFLHAVRNNGVIPLDAGKGLKCGLIFPQGNHCIFIWCPFCGLKNGYGEKALRLVYGTNGYR